MSGTAATRIALFGCGTVGSGVWRILDRQRERITVSGIGEIELEGICVRDPAKGRPSDIPRDLLTADSDRLIDDPSIDVVIETIGGEQEALGLITRALVAGKLVVTANKTVIAKHLPILKRLERLHGGALRYGAAVCGAIPVLKIIDETLSADRITSLRGIVNGSTNFILSRLAEGGTREEALALARRDGFLEADPTADLSGADAAQKLSILAWHAFGRHIPPRMIPTVGIESIDQREVDTAREQGCVIKLVAEASVEGEHLLARVAPQLVPLDDPFAAIADEVNIVEIESEGVGSQRLTGRGAGSLPTANAVVTDLLDLLRERKRAYLFHHALT